MGIGSDGQLAMIHLRRQHLVWRIWAFGLRWSVGRRRVQRATVFRTCCLRSEAGRASLDDRGRKHTATSTDITLTMGRRPFQIGSRACAKRQTLDRDNSQFVCTRRGHRTHAWCLQYSIYWVGEDRSTRRGTWHAHTPVLRLCARLAGLYGVL